MPAEPSTPLTIICACNNREILNTNLMTSPCLADGSCEFIVQEGYRNVPQAYNEGIARASHDLLCFLHQDVILPAGWPETLLGQVASVEAQDPDWGVLGCFGARIRENRKSLIGHVYDGCTLLGGPEGLPAEMDTLDELALICRKPDAHFDEGLPNYHLLGAELCLRLRRAGRKAYAIDAYCHHNSARRRLNAEFATGCGYLYAKYADMLPIATTCVTIVRDEGVCTLCL